MICLISWDVDPGFEYYRDDDEDDIEDEVDRFDPAQYDLSFASSSSSIPASSSSTATKSSESLQSVASTSSSSSESVETEPDYLTRTNTLLGIRLTVKRGQQKQADRMAKNSNNLQPECKVGDYVALKLADEDRGLTDAPNLICRIVDFNPDLANYELCCEVGCLEGLWHRNAFDLLKNAVEFPFNLNKKVAVREAVRLLSVGGGQGMWKCNCNGKCDTKRCSCLKNKSFKSLKFE